MKVLFISTLWPSQEYPQYVIFCEQLAQALIQAGVQLDVVIPSSKETACQRNGIRIINLDIAKFKDRLDDLVTREGYEIIHTHFVSNFKICSQIKSVCKKNNILFVYHKHGLNVLHEYFEKYPLYEKYLSVRKKRMYKKTDVVIGVSDKVSELVRTLVGKKEVYTLYNGVDLNKFIPAQKKENGVVEIICIGNLIKIKGQDYLIKALKLLRDEGYTNFNLSLYGRGVEEDNLRNLVEVLGLSESVSFNGYVEYDEVARHLRCADIFIMPSYFEALGCVYLEAMASKVCTIGCKNQGISEIIENGKNGFLVEEKSVESIYECIKKLIENPQKIDTVAEAGYNTVVNKYTWEDSAKSLIEIYDKLLAERVKKRGL